MIIVKTSFRKAPFLKSFLFTLKRKAAFSNPSGLKSVFVKLSSRDGSVWTVGLTVDIKLHTFSNSSSVVRTGRWPHGWCARLRIERSGFEPWPETLCCVLGQDTLLSQCPSPPRCINEYRRI